MSTTKGEEYAWCFAIDTTAWCGSLVFGAALVAACLPAQAKARVGTLSCDVSVGIGLIIFQKQTMTCTFTPDRGGPIGQYLGSIDEYGVALGAVEKGH
jgi:Protein of unknown function (DUF992)